MKTKLLAILCIVSLILCAVGCAAEEESTTVTGVVVSVEGSVISVRTMGNRGNGNANGEMRERPTGEGFPGRGENGEMPQRPTGEEIPDRPADGEMGERPTGEGFPERGENGEMPQRPTGEEAGQRPSFGGDNSQAESYDLSSAHISVEIDEGKAAGTMEDIKQGSIVTLTLNAKGEVTSVLVSSRSLSGFGNRGQGEGGKRPGSEENEQSTEEQAATTEEQAEPGV